MEHFIMLIGIVLISCALFDKVFGRTGVPGLFMFILLGMLFGSDGIFKIPFDNYAYAGRVCSAALVLIMYYGGVGTNFRAARPVLKESVLLSCAGTLITAALVGLFAVYVLKLPVLEGMLLGSVICSTDAASVFSILRSRKMNLRYGTASILELESGSNDPFSYMATAVVLALMNGADMGPAAILRMILLQVAVGLGMGFFSAFLIKKLLSILHIEEETLLNALLLGGGLLTYAVTAALAGNGYLSVYISGILIGNSHFPGKWASIRFFDSLTGLMQMLLFFMLGLLSYPSRIPHVALPSLLAALFLTFAARPAATALVLAPLRRPLNQIAFISFAGMRGAASIAFAILAISGGAQLSYDLYHMVFCIVLFSILVQGTLIPSAARRLDMIDDTEDVMATFNDYTREMPVQFVRCILGKDHPWEGRTLSEITMPPGSLAAAVIRRGREIIPKGDTVLDRGDEIILCGPEGGSTGSGGLHKVRLSRSDEWTDRKLSELSLHHELIVLIQRGGKTLIPSGDTLLQAGDELYVTSRKDTREA